MVVDNAEAFHQQEPQGAYQIVRKGRTWDLSKIDFDKLREEFKQTAYRRRAKDRFRASVTALWSLGSA
ncbi:MAG: hypothetical protein U1A62_11920 [Pseudomonas sp.]|nr:hypothetical protein [Pseudomonas sp.]